MTKDEVIAAALALSAEDRRWLYEKLVDSLELDPDAFPLTKEQIAHVDQRLAEHRANPSAVSDWEDVRAELFQRFGVNEARSSRRG